MINRFLLPMVIGAAFVTGAEASDDPVLVNPALYQVVFQNEHVRVHELFAQAGSRAAMHMQPPAVIVSLAKARFEVTEEDGTKSIVDLNPKQVFWLDRMEYSWKLLAGQAHAFFVEVRSAAADEPPAPVPLDPDDSVAVAPEVHHVVLENDHVRVFDGMAKPGDENRRHSHPPTVLISLGKSRFKVDIEGATHVFDFDPAEVYWIDHFTHAWEALAGQAHVIGVEVKSAWSAEAPARPQGSQRPDRNEGRKEQPSGSASSGR